MFIFPKLSSFLFITFSILFINNKFFIEATTNVTIDSYYQSADTFIVKGKFDLVYHESIVLKIGNLSINPNEVSESQLDFSIPHKGDSILYTGVYENCSITIVNSTISDNLKITIAPYLMEVQGDPPTQGGKITIKGYFLGGGPNSKTNNYKISIGSSFTCTNPTPIDSESLECFASVGYGRDNVLNFSLNDIESLTFLELSYQNPTINTISKIGLKGGWVTITGTNYHPVAEVFFVYDKCKNITVYDYNKIICEISSAPATYQQPSFVEISIGQESCSYEYSFLISNGHSVDKIVLIVFGSLFGFLVVVAILAYVYLTVTSRKIDKLYTEWNHKYLSLDSYEKNLSNVEQEEL